MSEPSLKNAVETLQLHSSFSRGWTVTTAKWALDALVAHYLATEPQEALTPGDGTVRGVTSHCPVEQTDGR